MQGLENRVPHAMGEPRSARTCGWLPAHPRPATCCRNGSVVHTSFQPSKEDNEAFDYRSRLVLLRTRLPPGEGLLDDVALHRLDPDAPGFLIRNAPLDLVRIARHLEHDPALLAGDLRAAGLAYPLLVLCLVGD